MPHRSNQPVLSGEECGLSNYSEITRDRKSLSCQRPGNPRWRQIKQHPIFALFGALCCDLTLWEINTFSSDKNCIIIFCMLFVQAANIHRFTDSISHSAFPLWPPVEIDAKHMNCDANISTRLLTEKATALWKREGQRLLPFPQGTIKMWSSWECISKLKNNSTTRKGVTWDKEGLLR